MNVEIMQWDLVLLASFNEDVAEELKKKILHPLPTFFSQTLPNQETLDIISCRFFTRFRWHETTILERYYIFVSE
jgi:hypothetical protein